MALPLIRFTQGGTTDSPGRAVVGAAGAAVTVTNGDNTGVLYWKWELIDAPGLSALATAFYPMATLSAGGTPSASFTPDVPGTYQVRLSTFSDGAGTVLIGQDSRDFIVPNARGWRLPASHSTDATFNYGGQPRGWARALEDIFNDILPSASTARMVGVDVKNFTAKGDGTTDDTAAIQNAHAAGKDVVYPPGTYLISSSVTFGTSGPNGTTHHFLRGAIIKPAAGVTVTFGGGWDVAYDQQVVDLSLGGTVAYANGGPDIICPAWFGALGQGGDDAPGVALASNLAIVNGATVLFHVTPYTYLNFNTQCIIGSKTVFSQGGLRWKFTRNAYNASPTAIVAGVPFNAGRPMIVVQNVIRAEFDGCSIDANGRADFCLQVRNDPGVGAAWHFVGDSCTMRNGRIAEMLSGEIDIEPTRTASSPTITATGHPLANGDPVYWFPVLKSCTAPGGFSLGTIYYVVNATTNTLQLSATPGGAAITLSTIGNGRLLLCKSGNGDTSVGNLVSPQFGAANSALCNPVAHYIHKGAQSFESTMSAVWFQGSHSTAYTSFTGNAGTNVLTLSGGSYATLSNGDPVVVWPSVVGTDVLPTGLTNDTEYYVVNASGSTCQLSLTVGGAPIALGTAGTGTLRIMRLTGAYWGAIVHDGSLNITSGVFTALYGDVRLYQPPGPSSQGCSLTMSVKSQSWRLLYAPGPIDGASLTQQVGSVVLNNCSHADIFGGSQRSVDYNLPNYSSLVIVGGAFYRDINIGPAAAAVQLAAPVLLPATGRTPALTGTTAKVHGSWWTGTAYNSL